MASGNAKLHAKQDSGVWEAAQRFWQKSYAGDYVGIIILLALSVPLARLGEPWHRLFRLDDPRIGFPHAEVERVDVIWLIVYALAIPVILLLVWAAATRPSMHKIHVTFLGLGTSILLTTFLTDLLKNAVGRPRPDLIARCQPSLDTVTDALVDVSVCTETRLHLLHDGWRSFPSGHSSMAFSALGYLALFLASQTHAIRPRASLVVVLLCLAPLLAAALIAISRLADYRHHPADVICGSLLGFLVAYFNWRRYYPSLLSTSCDEPHAPPGSGPTSPNGGFSRVRDAEEGYGTAEGRFSIGEDRDG